MIIYEILKVILLGIIEGITEWLPVSSTGHLIILDEILSLKVSEEFLSMFRVVIQLGAIAAVPVLFWEKLFPFSKHPTEKKVTIRLWVKVIVGSIPAALLGIIFDDLFDRYLYNYFVVALALIVYGIIFIFLEKIRAEKKNTINSINDLTYADALKIGLFQSLSLIPGTSRSGSSILGGMLIGASREISAEFSFFMAIPIMLGASLLKIGKYFVSGFTLSGDETILLLIGMVVSFVVSLAVIRFLMDYVKRHDFKIFGYYRIILGLIVLLTFLF